MARACLTGRRSCSSAGRTSASPRCSTASPAPAGRSSRPVAGTTRDVIAAPAAWKDRTFTLVDTGGLFGATTDPLHALVVEHGLKALDDGRRRSSSSLDAQEGLVPGDEEIAQRLHATGKPVILAINKTDDKRARGARARVLSHGFRAARSRCRPNTATASTSCSTRSSRACRRQGTRPSRRRTRRASRSSAGRTSASRRSSIACCARSA